MSDVNAELHDGTLVDFARTRLPALPGHPGRWVPVDEDTWAGLLLPGGPSMDCTLHASSRPGLSVTVWGDPDERPTIARVHVELGANRSTFGFQFDPATGDATDPGDVLAALIGPGGAVVSVAQHEAFRQYWSECFQEERRARVALAALVARMWRVWGPTTTVRCDTWAIDLPVDEAAALNGALGQAYGRGPAWDSDHPVSAVLRDDPDRGTW